MDLVCYKIVFGLICLETSDFFAFSLVRTTRRHPYKLFVPIQSLTLENISSVSVSLNHATALTLLKRTSLWGVSSLCWDVQIFRRTSNILSNHYRTCIKPIHSWLVCFQCLFRVGVSSVCLIFSLFLYFQGLHLFYCVQQMLK